MSAANNTSNKLMATGTVVVNVPPKPKTKPKPGITNQKQNIPAAKKQSAKSSK